MSSYGLSTDAGNSHCKKITGLSVVFSNVDCLTSKFQEVRCVLSANEADIYAFCEIKPKRTSLPLIESQIQISGYRLMTNLLTDGGRGIAIYVRETIQVGTIDIKSEYEPCVEQILISINLPGGPIILGCFYRSPTSTSLENSLSAICRSIDGAARKCKNLVIVGDFNLPMIEWTEGYGHTSNAVTQSFLDCLEAHSLFQAVTFPTRYREGQNPSLLDLVLVNDPESLIDIESQPPFGNSDHIAIKCRFRLYPQTSNLTRHVYTNYNQIRRELCQCDWSFVETMEVEDTWEKMKNMLLDTVSRNTTTTWRRKPKTLPFMTREMKSARNKKKKLSKLINQDPHRTDYLVKFKAARNKVRALSRELIDKYEEAIAATSKTNPKKFWNYASAHKPGRHTVSELVCNGAQSNDPQEIADALNHQFTSVFTPADKAPLPTPPCYEITTQMSPIRVDQAELESRLKKLNPNKSVGPDGIHPRLLKEAHSQLAMPLSRLFQKSIDTKVIPMDWKVAHISPIHKGGDKSKACSYRPISITSAVGKILEGIVNTAVLRHLITNNLLSKQQHGFRPGRSVETNLIDSYNYITELLDQGLPVDMILLDFAKAFDKVCHRRLHLKLKAIGIQEGVVDWITSFLKGRKQQVRVFGEGGRAYYSEIAEVLSGVPQGTVLGPTLFNVYINDAPRTVTSKLSLYADDSKLIGPVGTQQGVTSIQSDLDSFGEWAKTWRLEFNVEKCKVLHFGRNNPRWQYSMSANAGVRQPLSESPSERDLGVVVDEDLNFNCHTRAAVAKANQTLGLIKRTMTSRSPAIITKLYKSLVRPRLEFGMCVATPINKTDQMALESVQRRASKCVKGLRDKEYECRLQSLKLPTLTYRRRRGDMIMTYKLLKSDDKDLFQPAQLSRTRGHSAKLFRKRANTRKRNHFFSNRIISLWNDLSETTVSSPSVDSFKANLDKEWETKLWLTQWDEADVPRPYHH